jgi:hypothetical protein
VCEWCGRAFLLRDQPRRGRWLWWLVAALAVIVAAAIASLALMSILGSPRGTGDATLPALAPSPPSSPPTSVPSQGAEPAAEPTAQPVEYVRVTNTAGQGVILRREPSTGAARVAARAENAVLQIVGPDQAADGRVWRNVQDAQGNRGWVPADFLAAAPAPG